MRERGLEERRQQRRRAIEDAISRRQEARQFVRREQEKVWLTRLTLPAPREAQFLNVACALATLVTVGGLRGCTGIGMYVSYRWVGRTGAVSAEFDFVSQFFVGAERVMLSPLIATSRW